MARVGEAWKERRAMGERWASSWRDSRAGRKEVAIVVCGMEVVYCDALGDLDSRRRCTSTLAGNAEYQDQQARSDWLPIERLPRESAADAEERGKQHERPG